MYQKGSRFYADWRDAENVRHRKSFPTALGAQRYEAAQRKLRPSPRAHAARRNRTKAARGGAPLVPSSPRAATRRYRNSPLVKSARRRRATES